MENEFVSLEGLLHRRLQALQQGCMGSRVVHAVALCSWTGFLLIAVTQHSYTSKSHGPALKQAQTVVWLKFFVCKKCSRCFTPVSGVRMLLFKVLTEQSKLLAKS